MNPVRFGLYTAAQFRQNVPFRYNATSKSNGNDPSIYVPTATEPGICGAPSSAWWIGKKTADQYSPERTLQKSGVSVGLYFPRNGKTCTEADAVEGF